MTTRNVTNKRVVPVSHRLIGMSLNLISLIHTEWAAKQLSNLWFTVFKRRPNNWIASFWRGADRCIEVHLSNQSIPVHLWGKGPLIVMMHGWNGSGTQFRRFIPELVNAGFTVAVFDAPSHGQNPGRQSDVLQFSDSMVAIQDQIAPVHAVVAHSLGAMSTLLASQRGLMPNQLILLAPHLDVNEMFQSFSEMLQLKPRLKESFKQKVGEKMSAILNGENAWTLLEAEKMFQHDILEGMLVYDQIDEEVPLSHFQFVESLWPQAETLHTEGLGHVRLLKDEQVIQRVVNYLKKSKI